MAAQYEGSDATPRHNLLLSFAREHVTLVASVVAALLFAIRCAAVTNGDAYTASILLAHTSLGDAIRALLFSVLPFVLPYVSAMAALEAAARFRLRWLAPDTLGLLAVSVIASFLTWYLNGYSDSSWYEPIIVSFVVPAFWYLLFRLVLRTWLQFRRDLERAAVNRLSSPAAFRSDFSTGETKRERVPKRRVGTFRDNILVMHIALVVCIIVVIGIFSLAGQTFWLPRERLVFEGEAPFTGYVLKASEDYMVILNHDPRIIIQKRKSTLSNREFCYSKYYETESRKAGRDLPICPGRW
jgi:hypothetical protein